LVTGFFTLVPSSVLDRPNVSASWGLDLSVLGSWALVIVTGLLYRR
jgi:hypothetical protein